MKNKEPQFSDPPKYFEVENTNNEKRFIYNAIFRYDKDHNGTEWKFQLYLYLSAQRRNNLKHHFEFRTANLTKVLSRPTLKLIIRRRKGKQTKEITLLIDVLYSC